jgi:hypothetical protein
LPSGTYGGNGWHPHTYRSSCSAPAHHIGATWREPSTAGPRVARVDRQAWLYHRGRGRRSGRVRARPETWGAVVQHDLEVAVARGLGDGRDRCRTCFVAPLGLDVLDPMGARFPWRRTSRPVFCIGQRDRGAVSILGDMGSDLAAPELGMWHAVFELGAREVGRGSALTSAHPNYPVVRIRCALQLCVGARRGQEVARVAVGAGQRFRAAAALILGHGLGTVWVLLQRLATGAELHREGARGTRALPR